MHLSHNATYSTLTLTVQFKLRTPPNPHINGYRNGRAGGPQSLQYTVHDDDDYDYNGGLLPLWQ